MFICTVIHRILPILRKYTTVQPTVVRLFEKSIFGTEKQLNQYNKQSDTMGSINATLRTLNNLCNVSKSIDTITLIGNWRLSRLGHVNRMQDDKYPKRALEGKSEERRNRQTTNKMFGWRKMGFMG